jgi:hypothetical protein
MLPAFPVHSRRQAASATDRRLLDLQRRSFFRDVVRALADRELYMVAGVALGVERSKAATWVGPFSGKHARSNVDTRTQLPNHRQYVSCYLCNCSKMG